MMYGHSQGHYDKGICDGEVRKIEKRIFFGGRGRKLQEWKADMRGLGNDWD